MARKSQPPPGWITLHEIAVAAGLRHYYSLVWRLTRRAWRGQRLPWATLPVRRFRGVRCLRLRDREELGRRLDAWRSDRPWTRFAPRRRRRRRRRHG